MTRLEGLQPKGDLADRGVGTDHLPQRWDNTFNEVFTTDDIDKRIYIQPLPSMVKHQQSDKRTCNVCSHQAPYRFWTPRPHRARVNI